MGDAELVESLDCPEIKPDGSYCALPAEVLCRYTVLAKGALQQAVVLECPETHVYRGLIRDLVDLQPHSE